MSATKALKNSSSSAVVFSNGDIRGLHKTLLGLSILNLGEITIALNPRTQKNSYDKYIAVNHKLAKSLPIRLLHESLLGEPIAKLVKKPSLEHILFMREGDCIDGMSFSNLKASLEAVSLSYPSHRVSYGPSGSINTIHVNPDTSASNLQSKVTTVTTPALSCFFAVRAEVISQDLTLSSYPSSFLSLPNQIFADLVSESLTANIVPKAVFFEKEKKHSLDIPPIGRYNNLASLRGAAQDSSKLSANPPATTKQRVKKALENNPTLYLLGQKVLHYNSILRSKLPSTPATPARNELSAESDSWLIAAADEVHRYNSRVFLTLEPTQPFRKTRSSSSSEDTLIIQKCLNEMRHNAYDYVMVCPWLIAGGADMFFVNYLNTTAKLFPNKKVAVISTEPSRISLPRSVLKLSDQVDFIRLAEYVDSKRGDSRTISSLVATLLEMMSARVVHIGLSDAGYRYIENNQEHLKLINRKVIITGYNEIVTKSRREGYVHDIIPDIFDTADIVTTDNQKIIDLWSREYGLDTTKAVIHHQPFNIPKTDKKFRHNFSESSPVRVLWAAHIRKEKNPLTYRDIAQKMKDSPLIEFTAYGANDKSHYPRNPLADTKQSRLTYGGEYKNFIKDIKPDLYDIFVYTSLADGTPNILIEAGAADLPIISSGAGGIPSLLDGVGTLVNDPTDTEEYIKHLKQFISNPRPYYDKANAFKKKLRETQTVKSFDREVSEMLKRVGF